MTAEFFKNFVKKYDCTSLDIFDSFLNIKVEKKNLLNDIRLKVPDQLTAGI